MPSGLKTNDRGTPEERFWKKVKKGEMNECWKWIGAKNTKGYGVISIKARAVLTHRFS